LEALLHVRDVTLTPKEPRVQRNGIKENAQLKIATFEHEAPIAFKTGEQALSFGIPRYREDRGPIRNFQKEKEID